MGLLSYRRCPVARTETDDLSAAGWQHLSYLANSSFPSGHPLGLHQDHGLVDTYQFLEAPVHLNTVYILQDVDEVNGQRNMGEGYGDYGSRKPGDGNGAIVNARLAMDAGEYYRIGELSPGVPPAERPTLKAIQEQHESRRVVVHQVIQSIKAKQSR